MVIMENNFKLTALQIAEMIHAVTSKIPRMDGSIVESWDELDDCSKLSASKAVEMIYSSPKKTAQELHDLWMQLKVDDGWGLGEYNLADKKHPCIIKFDELPESEKCKDFVWEHLTAALYPFYSKD